MFQFIQKAFTNQSLLDTGKALRQYCYITDAVYARVHSKIFKVNLDHSSGVWNVSNPHSISIYELANVISLYLDVPLSIPSSDSSTVLDALDSCQCFACKVFKSKSNYVFSIHSSMPFRN